MSSLRSLVAYLRFRHRRFRDRTALERWQERKVRSHLKWVCARSDWFREVACKYPIERWREWPENHRDVMNKHLERWCTVQIQPAEAWKIAERSMKERDFSPMLPGNISVGMSSGTSGSPGLFLAGAEERAEWAGAILAKVLSEGLFARKWRLALFLRANNNLYQATKGSQVQFKFFDLAGETERHWAELNDCAPHLLAAPPRVLLRLAEARLAGDIAINPPKILSVAEVLEPWMKQRIEEIFRVRCDQIYQATEGFLGVTCSQGTLHLNEDIAVVQREPVGTDPNVFRPVITDFCRRTQPIIRYRMEDILQVAPHGCACGSPFLAIEQIIGRSDESCLLFSESGESREVMPDFLRLAAAKVLRREFRLVNFAVGKLRVEACEITSSEKEALVVELRGASALSKCLAPEISFDLLAPQRWQDKFRRVTRTISH